MLSFSKTNIDSTTFDLIVPDDCPNYLFNSGLMIWNRTSSTADALLTEWINRTLKYKNFPWEQQALKDWYEESNSTLTENKHFSSIPYGAETWHVGSCSRGDMLCPTLWHIL